MNSETSRSNAAPLWEPPPLAAALSVNHAVDGRAANPELAGDLGRPSAARALTSSALAMAVGLRPMRLPSALAIPSWGRSSVASHSN